MKIMCCVVNSLDSFQLTTSVFLSMYSLSCPDNDRKGHELINHGIIGNHEPALIRTLQTIVLAPLQMIEMIFFTMPVFKLLQSLLR